MIQHLFKRTVSAILVLWGVVTLIFFLFNVLPGDASRMMTGQRADKETIEAIRKDLGLDRPVGMQYIKYLNDLSFISVFNDRDPASYFYLDQDKYSPTISLGKISGSAEVVLKWPYLRRSYQSRRNVTDMILEAFPNTLILAVAAILFASILGIILGIFAALKSKTVVDRLIILFSALGMSLPSFFAAILIGWIFSYLLHNYTGLNLTGNLTEIDDLGRGVHLELKNLVLPAFTLGIRPLAVVTQLTRNSMLDILSEDYIRTARACGLPKRKIIGRYALKNALNPVVTAISGWFASMMAGVIFIEYIFGWKGLGYLMVDALNNYDLPVVMGCVITIALIFVSINILVDMTYAWLDPRIRFKS